MKVKQLPDLSTLFEIFSKSTSIAQLLTVGSLAVSISSAIAVAPAGAVSLANGDLTFGTSTLPSFFADVNPGLNDTIEIAIGASTNVGSANGSLENAPFFTAPGSYNFGSPNPVALLNWVSGANNGPIAYELANPIDFNFTNGVNLKIAAGTLFTGNMDTSSVSLSTILRTGSFFENNGDVAPLNALSFGFNDIGGTGNGTYGITASTQSSTTSVPEPFTIIGTIIGGAAAMRMRKKLADADKN
jgi:hypothetical protein